MEKTIFEKAIWQNACPNGILIVYIHRSRWFYLHKSLHSYKGSIGTHQYYFDNIHRWNQFRCNYIQNRQVCRCINLDFGMVTIHSHRCQCHSFFQSCHACTSIDSPQYHRYTLNLRSMDLRHIRQCFGYNLFHYIHFGTCIENRSPKRGSPTGWELHTHEISWIYRKVNIFIVSIYVHPEVRILYLIYARCIVFARMTQAFVNVHVT